MSDLTVQSYESFVECYQGFIILRDTKINTLGRSYLSPGIIKGYTHGYLALVKTEIHLNGFIFNVTAFPWMLQDANTNRCAHVALWSIIRYFSNKYSFYPERTLHQITELNESEQRKNPSVGMTIEQIAQVLRDSNFFPGVYFKNTMSDITFSHILYVIIESGLPFIAALTEGVGEGHAIAIIGHGPVESAVKYSKGKSGILDSSELVSSLIASDDNYIPYSRVDKNVADITGKNGNKYAYSNIGAIVVPFYEKMFLDICAIFRGKSYRGCLDMIERNYLTLPSISPVVRRVLLTSSKSYKQFVVQNSTDEYFRKIISLIEMPKFIWLAEYSTPEDFDSNKVGWNIILDATAMNYQQDIFLAIKNRNQLMVNQGIINEKPPIMQYDLAEELEIRYTNNLEAI